MAVLAHPDDESLGLGGTLAKYASEGVEIALLTATRGESGRSYLGPGRCLSHGRLARNRQRPKQIRIIRSITPRLWRDTGQHVGITHDDPCTALLLQHRKHIARPHC